MKIIKIIGSVIAILFFTFPGIFLLINGTKPILEARQSITWPTTEGKVFKSELVTHSSGGDENGETDTWEKAEISYQYQINGKQYSGEKISHFKTLYSNVETLEKFPVEKKILLHYNPEKPEIAVVVPGKFTLEVLFFGLVFSVIGIRLYMRVRRYFHFINVSQKNTKPVKNVEKKDKTFRGIMSNILNSSIRTSRRR
ncbi:MAG: DUF3592 domain-containing protein [Candidatus Marinimicrobia bacterium]|nr:DUF3592 domain-containing protein [Candidatus Neomarinimicrobiota bacterium]